jgi:hypothetical protein
LGASHALGARRAHRSSPWKVVVRCAGDHRNRAPLGIHVRDHLKPRGFDVAGSGSDKARSAISDASGADPANSVLALIRLPAPYGAPGAREVVRQVERKLASDAAVVKVLDASSAQNPAMVARDRRSTYVIAALRPLSDAEQEATCKRLVAAFAGDERVTLAATR